MSEVPEGLRYTQEHEYVREADTDGEYFVGITDYAQGELGDVVFVELPAVGDTFEHMQVFGTIEAVKAVSELFCPLAGEVVEVNEALDRDPALVNTDPYGAGWMIRLKAAGESGTEDLLSAEAYRKHLEEG